MPAIQRPLRRLGDILAGRSGGVPGRTRRCGLGCGRSVRRRRIAYRCGLTATGATECWGNTGSGGEHIDQAGPFTFSATGGSNTGGIKTDKAIQCWSSSSFGVIIEVPTDKYTDVDVDVCYACDIKETDEMLACWGYDGLHGTPHAQISGVPSSTRYVSIAAGDQFTCAVDTSGAAGCWGLTQESRSALPSNVTFKTS